eukprot:4864361-Karenia_brevis.AAC.1
MERPFRTSFNSVRPKVINIILGITIGSVMAFILKAAIRVQVPHWPSPMDKAGAVPRDTASSATTAHPTPAGLEAGPD